ncbi:MAG: putative 2-aminoethylphosphonate ABC transporter ATP-binding protein [Oceanibaculum nanhaiense]|uniref:putative 2-aminoethylphosphonate ABC transporter ATP-binding protein n=1 Tax=Oceanibaculum nanhaiense TaxID=1909734 RepID=UPI0025A3A057|nr:putative 2-aminoethylphosphonate ABC transporter ATP-binding protein [Oceanibaculum nanhaiense]MDM7945613.1 putative 2-aminoethylphosphonate ABC transporter ATP-binding protein [Oceanibaculum nanhaiense]
MTSATLPDAYLRIRGLTKRFGSVVAVDSVSLDVAEGEFVCLLGPSGCGKTTVLRAIAGLEMASEGTIHQSGRDVTALPPGERDFGIVFQSYALFPNLTAARNISFGLQGRGMPAASIAARVADLLALVGLAEEGHKFPAQLSGGMQQRVALARALAPSPGLLLLDEPLSALDAKVRGHLRQEIKALQRRLGVTTIMVTHDQEEALTMADRVVVMNSGAIEQVGTPETIYDRPASPFVADFIGTMNLVTVTVAGPGQLRCGDVDLACTGMALPDAGQSVLMAVRPEDIRPVIEGTGSDNALQVRVSGLEYLGAQVRAEVRTLDDALALRLDLPGPSMRDRPLHEGDVLTISLPADRIRLYTPAGGRL